MAQIRDAGTNPNGDALKDIAGGLVVRVQMVSGAGRLAGRASKTGTGARCTVTAIRTKLRARYVRIQTSAVVLASKMVALVIGAKRADALS